MMRLAIPKLNLRLKDVMQRVLIVAGSDDQLLPSAEEAKRLSKAFQRSAVHVVQGGGHSLLQEAGVDLLSIVKVSDAEVDAEAPG
jgi:pimeloyl-ACP methyl ester carboxylesterase